MSDDTNIPPAAGDDADPAEQLTFFDYPRPDQANAYGQGPSYGWPYSYGQGYGYQWGPPEVPEQPSGRRSRLRIAAAIAAGSVALAFGGWGVADVIGSGIGAGSSGRHGHLPTVHGLTTSQRSVSSVASDVERSVVDIVAKDGGSGDEDAGTGQILTSTGEILTNNHVVDGATQLEAKVISTGKVYKANVVGTDATDDVAVIQLVGASGLTPITAGDSDAVSPGTSVIAIGNAEGTGGVTVTTGKITGIGKSISASDGDGTPSERLHGMLEVNADIISGDSGGPLSDAAGQVIGMDTAAASTGQQGFGTFSNNITSSSDGFAIPIKTALAIANQIVDGDASSTVTIGTPGLLGVEVANPGAVSSGSEGFGFPAIPGFPGSGRGLIPGYSQPKSGSSSVKGAEVVGVVQGDPAAKAGITSGDVITAVNGNAISSAAALTKALAATHSGDTVTVTWSDASGSSHSASVTLANGAAN